MSSPGISAGGSGASSTFISTTDSLLGATTYTTTLSSSAGTSLTSVTPTCAMSSSLLVAGHYTTGFFYEALQAKNRAHSADISGSVNREYNRLLEEQGITEGLIPHGLDGIGSDQATVIVRPDLHYFAIKTVLAAHNDTTEIKPEISTATFFELLHKENVERRENLRGVINLRYNELLFENGIEGGEIPGGRDLELLGRDQGTVIIRPDLYFAAYREVLNDFPSHIREAAAQTIRSIFEKTAPEARRACFSSEVEKLSARISSSSDPKEAAVLKKVRAIFQKITHCDREPGKLGLYKVMDSLQTDRDCLNLLASSVTKGAIVEDYRYLKSCAASGNTTALRRLLTKGISVHDAGKYWMACNAANGHVNALRVLIAAEADNSLEGALTSAAQNGHIEAVRFLIGAGANVSASYALAEAARNGHTAILELLLDAGADIRRETRYNNYALIYSAENGHLDCLELLLARGGDRKKLCLNFITTLASSESLFNKTDATLLTTLTAVGITLDEVYKENPDATRLPPTGSKAFLAIQQGIADRGARERLLGLRFWHEREAQCLANKVTT